MKTNRRPMRTESGSLSDDEVVESVKCDQDKRALMKKHFIPCPFCGETPLVYRYSHTRPNRGRLICSCGLKTPKLQSFEDLISFWNTRQGGEGGKQKMANYGKLLKASKELYDQIREYGDWDDGCFYYQNKSASELEKPLRDLEKIFREIAQGRNP